MPKPAAPVVRLRDVNTVHDLLAYLTQEANEMRDAAISAVVDVTGISRKRATEIVVGMNLDDAPEADADGGTNFNYGQYHAYEEARKTLAKILSQRPGTPGIVWDGRVKSDVSDLLDALGEELANGRFGEAAPAMRRKLKRVRSTFDGSTAAYDEADDADDEDEEDDGEDIAKGTRRGA